MPTIINTANKKKDIRKAYYDFVLDFIEKTKDTSPRYKASDEELALLEKIIAFKNTDKITLSVLHTSVAELLGYLEYDEKCEEFLVKMLDNKDWLVRTEAAESLGCIARKISSLDLLITKIYADKHCITIDYMIWAATELVLYFKLDKKKYILMFEDVKQKFQKYSRIVTACIEAQCYLGDKEIFNQFEQYLSAANYYDIENVLLCYRGFFEYENEDEDEYENKDESEEGDEYENEDENGKGGIVLTHAILKNVEKLPYKKGLSKSSCYFMIIGLLEQIYKAQFKKNNISEKEIAQIMPNKTWPAKIAFADYLCEHATEYETLEMLLNYMKAETEPQCLPHMIFAVCEIVLRNSFLPDAAIKILLELQSKFKIGGFEGYLIKYSLLYALCLFGEKIPFYEIKKGIRTFSDNKKFRLLTILYKMAKLDLKYVKNDWYEQICKFIRKTPFLIRKKYRFIIKDIEELKKK